MNDEDNKIFELLIDLPYLRKGKDFYFEMDSGHIYGMENGKKMEYPLRPGLSQYLWLLLTDGGQYFKVKEIKANEEDSK